MKEKISNVFIIIIQICVVIGFLTVLCILLESCSKEETKIKDLGVLKVCGEEIDLNQEYDPVDGISGEYLSEYLNEACDNYYKVER